MSATLPLATRLSFDLDFTRRCRGYTAKLDELEAAQADLDRGMRNEWLACSTGMINLPRQRAATERLLTRVELLEREVARLRADLDHYEQPSVN